MPLVMALSPGSKLEPEIEQMTRLAYGPAQLRIVNARKQFRNIRKRKRPRGRRMRGLISNTAWEEECRIPYRVLGGGANSMNKCLTGPLPFSNDHSCISVMQRQRGSGNGLPHLETTAIPPISKRCTNWTGADGIFSAIGSCADHCSAHPFQSA